MKNKDPKETTAKTVDLSTLRGLYGKHPALQTIVRSLAQERKSPARLFLSGLAGSAPALLFAELADRLTQVPTFLLVCDDEESAGYLQSDLVALMGGEEQVFFLPSLYRRGIRYGQPDAANEVLRSEIADRLRGGGEPPRIIVTYAAALPEGFADQAEYEAGHIDIALGEEYERKSLRERLWSLGFEETDYVYMPGQFAVRGSLIDIYSYAQDLPVRIDFIGDEVETISFFDPESQLSGETMERVRILAPIDSKSKSKCTSLLELLPAEAVVYVPSHSFFPSTLRTVYEMPPVHPEDNIFHTLEEMQARLIEPETVMAQLEHFSLLTGGVDLREQSQWREIAFREQPEPLFHKKMDLLAETLSDYQHQSFATMIMSDQESQLGRLHRLLAEREQPVHFVPLRPTLHGGFIDHEIKLCLLTDHSIFERYHGYRLKSDRIRKRSSALTLQDIRGFEYGDYVVHSDYGVAQFGGLCQIEQNGEEREAVRLNFKGGDSLYVSINALSRISKYKSKDVEEAPQLNKLGSGAWDRLKDKTKKKVKEIARDLIKLYAQRLKMKGFAFSPDTYLQQELEASFMYEDTPDQEKATEEVKADMESPVPMDRLVCGDVGFGKTEIAVRAAFKACADSKQVAVMVPTTVLAYQHYHTFKKRLKDFPVRVDYLNAARQGKERTQLLKDLAEGKIDILIGTHSLAGKGVKFKDLGLLIIDEEQKFGVAVKEKIRKMRAEVDTLTMTATPIPRTLQFSLMGARDLSNILTPPPNRHPVRTDHTTYSPEVLADAINAELARDGQVFVINNRIRTIESVEEDIRKAVPGVRIGVGHGQMPAKELEKVLTGFVNQEYDVLLATSVVENGIDVPNANTIIVNEAQRFGLSDLHQLRGRVGRGDRQAYCILLTPPADALTDTAKRRLESIVSFAELGSGIQIAMQDLDIRGAGNLLGSEQSGFIADLGYETYKQVLEEAVRELKDEEFADLFPAEEEPVEQAESPSPSDKKGHRRSYVSDTSIDTDVAAYFPQTYVPGDEERMRLYRELDGIQRKRDLLDFYDRMVDRFGPMPREGEELLHVVELRLLAQRCGVERVLLKRGLLKLTLVRDLHSPYYRSPIFSHILQAAAQWGEDLRFKEEKGDRSISVRGVETLRQATTILERLSGLTA